MPADTAQVTHWLESLLGAPRDKDPRHVVTHSENDHLWYRDGHPFVPAHASRLGDVTTVHSWIFNGVAGRYGALSDESVRHAEWMIELARAFATDLERPVWLQEVGAPDRHLAESEMPEFLERTVAAALTTERLHAVTWWCSHDVSRSLADFPELEYDLGLLTNDGRVKPTGERFREMALAFGDGRHRAPTPPSTALVLDDVTPDGGPRHGSRADSAPGGRFAAAWLAIAEQDGRGPQVVLRSRLGDRALLAARGVTTCVDVPADAATAAVSVAHPATMP